MRAYFCLICAERRPFLYHRTVFDGSIDLPMWNKHLTNIKKWHPPPIMHRGINLRMRKRKRRKKNQIWPELYRCVQKVSKGHIQKTYFPVKNVAPTLAVPRFRIILNLDNLCGDLYHLCLLLSTTVIWLHSGIQYMCMLTY